MKTLFLAIITAVAAFQFMLVARPVLAQDTKTIVCKSVNQVDASCGDDKILGPSGILTRIVQTLIFIIGAIAILVIVIGGLMYVVSAGNPDQTRKAKDAILFAIIGIIIALLAQAIVFFVLRRVG